MSSQDSQPLRWHYTQLNDHDFQIRGRTLFFITVLFSVVILVALLFFYARWVCRFHHDHFPANHTSHAPHAPPPGARGLDPTSIKALPTTSHRKSSSPSNVGPVESECSICLGVFEDGEKVKVLPRCHHCFHCDCVDKWLATQSNCPLCRASLTLESETVSIVTE